MDGATLQLIHGHTRWLVVAGVVLAALFMLIGIAQNRTYDKLAYRMMIAFSSVIGLQWLLGVLVFLILGLNVGYRWEHAVTNTIALAVAHLHIPLYRRLQGAQTASAETGGEAVMVSGRVMYWRGLLIIGVTMALVYVGVARLPYEAWAF